MIGFIHIRNITAILLFFALYSCGYRQIIHSQTSDDKQEGIVVAGTYRPGSHSLLYLTSGIYVSINGGQEIRIPWTESKYFDLTSGKHKFKIWYNWFGKAGIASGCFTLEPGQLLYFEYHPSMWGAFSEPELIIIDKRESVPVIYEEQCSN